MRPAGTELTGDSDSCGLGDPQRHHKGDARAVENELVRTERRRPQKAHQDARGHEDSDFDSSHPADRQPEAKYLAHLDPACGDGVTQQPQRRQARHDADAQPETAQHQPLVDRARIARARGAERRCAETAEDQHPIEHRIAGNADQDHCHHRTRMRECREQAAQHRKAEKSGPTPGERPQIAADLGGERGIVAERPKQHIQTRQYGDEGQRQQHRQHRCRAGNPTCRMAIAGAERIGGERCDG